MQTTRAQAQQIGFRDTLHPIPGRVVFNT